MALHNRIENFIHALRHKQVAPFLEKCSMMGDLGCGQQYSFLKTFHHLAHTCWGLDINVPDGEDQNIILKRYDITQRLPFENNSFNQITILAVLEHIKTPQELLRECYRILTPGGRIIITTPSKFGIFVHDILRMARLVQDIEPEEHIDFSMSKNKLAAWTRDSGFDVEVIKGFEMGINILLVGRKKAAA